jgi:hypothetical protein
LREILERIRLHELTVSERDVRDHVFVDSGGPEKMCHDPDARARRWV